MKFRLKLRGRPAVAAAMAACALTVAVPTAMAQTPNVDLRSPDASATPRWRRSRRPSRLPAPQTCAQRTRGMPLAGSRRARSRFPRRAR